MIFVTGGTGLVGSHILLNLAKSSRNFRALRREKSSLDVCRQIFTNYNAIKLFNNINWVIGDVNDLISLEEGMSDCTEVIHAAGLVSFHPKDADKLRKINIEGTENIVNTCLDLGVKKLAYVSSIATLGKEKSHDHIDEECYFTVKKSESNYALSKYYAEQEVWRASQEGLDVVIVNPTIILGPGDWTKGSSQVFQKASTGLSFYTSGSTGYVDALDVARATIELLDSKIINERFVVNSENMYYKLFFEILCKEFGKPKPSIKVSPYLIGLIWRFEALRSFFTNSRPLITKETAISAMTKRSFSNKKIIKTLKFQFVPVEASIKKYCSWYKKDLS